ncbi:MAG: hypothetical protein AAB896_01655 [Patescibacteria group bacterium]
MLTPQRQIQFETVGELKAAAHATGLVDFTASEYETLLTRAVFDPYLWGRRNAGIEVPDETPLISTFYSSPDFSPWRIVQAIRKVANAKEVIDPYAHHGQPSAEYLRMLRTGQRKLRGALRPILRSYDAELAKLDKAK